MEGPAVASCAACDPCCICRLGGGKAGAANCDCCGREGVARLAVEGKKPSQEGLDKDGIKPGCPGSCSCPSACASLASQSMRNVSTLTASQKKAEGKVLNNLVL